MEKSSALLPSAIIALGIVVLGFTVRSGIVTFKDRDRIVSVKGLSEREVKADKVIFLKSGGLTDSEISVNPPTIVDRQADNYGNEIMNFRYKATSVITVTSPNVDKVRALMNRQAELMKQDIAIVGEEYGGSNSPSYEFTGLNKIKPEMVEEATKNARITAEKFASDSGSELGDIRSASQGQFSIESRDASTPFMKKVRVVTTLEYTLK